MRIEICIRSREDVAAFPHTLTQIHNECEAGGKCIHCTEIHYRRCGARRPVCELHTREVRYYHMQHTARGASFGSAALIL